MTLNEEDLKNIITDRLLRMGLIGQPVTNHSHAIELLVRDIMDKFKAYKAGVREEIKDVIDLYE